MSQMKLLKFYLLTNQGRIKWRQIEQISHNMLIDKVCEEYPEIHMQARLFHVNQLFLKRIMENFLIPKRLLFILNDHNWRWSERITAENVLKLLNNGLSDRNLIKRLFEDQMTKTFLPTAEGIVWELKQTIMSISACYLRELD
jgi:hypothetical protein